MTGYLLDANLLIALCVSEHEHHELARQWMANVSEFATCPIVEGALVRYLVRIGVDRRSISQILSGISARPGYHHWSDAVSYRKVDLGKVRGHRQVTDAYLVSLAQSHDGWQLATLDQGLAENYPDQALLIGPH